MMSKRVQIDGVKYIDKRTFDGVVRESQRYLKSAQVFSLACEKNKKQIRMDARFKKLVKEKNRMLYYEVVEELQNEEVTHEE